VTIRGECFCGSIRYSIDGGLRNARSCHCSRCRKAFSSQASTYAEVHSDDFKWDQGEELLSTYESQEGFGLQFCSVCGSTLCGIFDGKVHGVTLGCLLDDPKIEIGMHIFVGSKASWEIISGEVLQFEEGVPADN